MNTILFDLDGTLVDSGPPIMAALNDALASIGLDALPQTEASRFIGPPLYETIPEHLAAHGRDPALFDSVLDAYRRSYSARSVRDTTVYPGIYELLASLTGHARLGVVTSKPRPTALPIIETTGLLSMFEIVEGPDLQSNETKVVTLGRAMASMNTEGHATTMVGDRHHDVVAGRAHGTWTVGVTWGYGTANELDEAAPHHVVVDPADLGRVLTAGFNR